MQTKTSLIHSILAELQKLHIPAIRNTAIIGLAIYLLLTFVLTDPSFYGDYTQVMKMSYRIVGQSWTMLVLFAIIMGSLAVTAEYSHNTMRTTLLAIPNRYKAASAKFIAVALSSLGYFTLVMLLAALLAKVRLGNSLSYSSSDAASILVTLLVLVITTLMSTAFGYLLRSTAGTMAMMIFLFFIAEMVRVIPQKFFYETLPNWLPMALGERAIEVGLTVEDEVYFPGVVDPYFSSPWLALAILGGYLAIVIASALLVYRKRDA
ncbi:MAG: hypothetical protein Q4E03_00765 [Trueperella sp.]|nr:hypothetical protein [Trueperella sp.]